MGGNKGENENRELLYKLVKSDTKLIKAMLETRGFHQTEAHDWNILWSCGNTKPYIYEGLNEFQKVNHFPNSNELTHKDRLAFHISNSQRLLGRFKFDFLPETFILPEQFPEFYTRFNRNKGEKDIRGEAKNKDKDKNNLWIIKPYSQSQGRGIFLIDDLNEVPCDESCIVSEYIKNPLLINGLKFDLRIYVLLTSVDPLRIYVFNEGLARFATELYDQKICKENRFVFLTNYSVNKKNERFVQNIVYINIIYIYIYIEC